MRQHCPWQHKAQLGVGAGLELVSAVAGADSDCQRVTAGAGHELFNFFGTGVGSSLSGDVDFVFEVTIKF